MNTDCNANPVHHALPSFKLRISRGTFLSIKQNQVALEADYGFQQ